MRTVIIVFICLIFLGCNKDKAPVEYSILKGEWRLESVFDKSNLTFYSKPIGAPRDIIIRFSGKKFSGQTLVNTFSNGSFVLEDASKLTFGSFNSTTIIEEQWGSMFLTVLNACGLQSVHPCLPSQVTVQGNSMKIESALRYDLNLIRN